MADALRRLEPLRACGLAERLGDAWRQRDHRPAPGPRDGPLSRCSASSRLRSWPLRARADSSGRRADRRALPVPGNRQRRNQQQQQHQQQPAAVESTAGIGQQRQAPAEFTRAPAPRRPDVTPTANVLVFGDSMSEWLAYGLEEAFAETPEIGIMRKPRANTGLIRVEQRGESYDWPAAARDILNAEKPDFVVMMLGTADRRGIREAIRQQPARPPAGQKQDQAKQARAGASRTQPAQPAPPAAERREAADAEAPPAEDRRSEQPAGRAGGGADRRHRGA